jgi:hypothetical protein
MFQLKNHASNNRLQICPALCRVCEYGLTNKNQPRWVIASDRRAYINSENKPRLAIEMIKNVMYTIVR